MDGKICKYWRSTFTDGIRNITRKLGIHINENKTKIVRMDQIFRYLQVQYQVTDSVI